MSRLRLDVSAVLLSPDIGKTVAGRNQNQNGTQAYNFVPSLFLFFSFLILPVTHSCPPSLLQVCASPLAFHRASDFCVVELLFLFVPLTIPYTIAACLPPDSSVCQRWLQQNRLWEQPVSLPWSPAPQPEGQPSIQRSPYPCTHTEAQTHKYPTKLILTQKPYNAHTLSQ